MKNGFRESDPSILPLHFPPSNLGLNKGEVVSLLTHLDLYRSFEASDEVDFSPLLLFHYISLESSRGEMLSTDEVNFTLLGPLQDLSRVTIFDWDSAALA